MSFVKGLFSHTRKSIDLTSNPLNSTIQIRTAKKRVSGSRTNNKDSAGRRLGPKKNEGHFVNPGQIIMRQRGSKIHPGDNVKIGIDHTIFAIEPGYVRYYFDPFHPLRKYVGVSLKKNLKLPRPHFEPRLRRFGYIEIIDPIEAKIEESNQSRKEKLAQPELNKLKEAKLISKNEFIESTKKNLIEEFDFNSDPELSSSKKLQDASERLYNIYQLRGNGQSLSEARIQTTFNTIYDLKLQIKRSKINNDDNDDNDDSLSNLINETKEFITKIDSMVGVEPNGKIYKNLTKQEQSNLQQEIISKLITLYQDKALEKNYRIEVEKLINTPGVFEPLQKQELVDKYLPEILPMDYPGSIIEIDTIDSKKLPKNIITQRIFDETTRKVKLIGRPKEAFAST
ncbi:mitochondrial ribosomal protein of the large subunit, putative [Candida dubliniensis CD36]|uniref:Large ribosomal subunit protein bL27m n=1 Tax=Candida dubliniensis (strain CD36 / ATCC MYA-646 / CBS 7987 / NCPF 3949 / NRRL Y-17841) TaxID=573826 RepID=B9WJT4_CANDC|nr:mitochondrial 54S ribosomal protein YmL2 [Candida dubliniensis CD36]CAX40894.1 mitochondrial ribosomal protein of the large subunit, putative [Candida dubliniensis CD36]